MLNSPMHSAKQEAFVKMKEVLINRMAEQDKLRKTCREKIEELEDLHIKWYATYVIACVCVLGSVGAITFINFGYSEISSTIIKNLFWIAAAGFVSYFVIIFNQFQNRKIFKQQWREIEDGAMSEIKASKEAIKVFNENLYVR